MIKDHFRLDNELLKQSGEFNLHFLPETHAQEKIDLRTSSALKENLHLDKPIASGITAFFIKGHGSSVCLVECLENGNDFKSEDLYNFYWTFIRGLAIVKNDRHPNPLPIDAFTRKFSREHYDLERLSMVNSMQFFNMLNTRYEGSIGSKIKSYVDGYLSWLESKIREIENPADGAQSPVLNFISEEKYLDSYPDLEYIQMLENFINYLFFLTQNQARFLERSIDSLDQTLTLPKVNYNYYLVADHDLFRIEYHKYRIRKLIISGSCKQDYLQIFLKSSLKTALSLVSLYKNSINGKEFDEQKFLILEYDQVSGQITSEPVDQDECPSNCVNSFDFAIFSSQFAEFLRSEIGVNVDDTILRPIVNSNPELSESSISSNSEFYSLNNNTPTEKLADIESCLKELTVAYGYEPPCITIEVMNYLAQSIEQILNDKEPDPPKSKFEIKNNTLFYTAINKIISSYHIKPKKIIELLSGTFELKEQTIRNNLSLTKTQSSV